MSCPYNQQSGLPPCISVYSKKWGYLKDFLLNRSKGDQYLSIVHSIKCIDILKTQIKINDYCIKCLFCVLNCPGNLISFKKDFTPEEGCSEFVESNNKIDKNAVQNFFTNELVKIPYLHVLSSKKPYNTLDEFTEINETKNIAVWAASLIKYLSKDINCRLGLEIKMIIESRDRGGRLDICLLSNENVLLAAETKISFAKMMQEGRYVSQMISYKEEINKNLQDLTLSEIKNYEFLLIDGRESDLLFSTHKDCSTKVGNQSEIFYKNIVEHNLFFISATALWALSLKKLFIDKDKYSIENILGKMVQGKDYGLVSAGVITRDVNDNFIIKELDDYLD